MVLPDDKSASKRALSHQNCSYAIAKVYDPGPIWVYTGLLMTAQIMSRHPNLILKKFMTWFNISDKYLDFKCNLKASQPSLHLHIPAHLLRDACFCINSPSCQDPWWCHWQCPQLSSTSHTYLALLSLTVFHDCINGLVWGWKSLDL